MFSIRRLSTYLIPTQKLSRISNRSVLQLWRSFLVILICLLLISLLVMDNGRINTMTKTTPISAPYTAYTGPRLSVGIGMGITTRGMERNATGPADLVLRSIPFFKTLLPSFCDTASVGFYYPFYIAYDYNDPLLTNSSFLTGFTNMFTHQIYVHCPRESNYSLRFIQCSHAGNPAWAQNDAAKEAYLSGIQYFYRINDDTVMRTRGWTETFIRSLDGAHPPNIGVVGPKHVHGNLKVLTYDFTHRTHIEIHGCHYPRVFTDWGADVWITMIYHPGRAIKSSNISLVHTEINGVRYEVRDIGTETNRRVTEKARKTIAQYAEKKERGFPVPDPRMVVSLELTGNNSADISWGLVRNAQLMPLLYPGWSMWVYVPEENTSWKLGSVSFSLSREVRNTLTRLGVRLKTAPSTGSCRSYLVADDPDVDVFLIRNADERLSERDATAVQNWLKQASDGKFVHVIKDHHKLLQDSQIVSGQWGAKAKPFRSKLGGRTMEYMLNSHMQEGDSCETFLNNKVWPQISSNILCHDSIHCMSGSGCEPFPGRRGSKRYVGQKYDSHESLVNHTDFLTVLSNRLPQCSRQSFTS